MRLRERPRRNSAPTLHIVMAGLSRPKDGVTSARLCPGHPRLYSRRPKTWMPGTRPGMTKVMRTKLSKSIRLGRRRRAGRAGRLRSRLRLAADDDGDQPLAPQPLCGLPGVVERDRVDDGGALVEIVDRQLVELILQQRRGELRGCVELQHLRALEVGLRLVQFLLGRTFLGDLADFAVDRLDGV